MPYGALTDDGYAGGPRRFGVRDAYAFRPSRPLATQHTRVDASASLVTLQEARDELALFADSTMDDTVTRCIHSAESMVGRMLGTTLVAADIVDRYTGFTSEALLLSNGWLAAAPALSVHYRAPDSDSLTALDARHVIVDPTTENPSVRVRANPLPELSGDYAGPVEVHWRSDPAGATQGLDDVRAAVRFLVSALYETRGVGELPMGWTRAVRQLLGVQAFSF